MSIPRDRSFTFLPLLRHYAPRARIETLRKLHNSHTAREARARRTQMYLRRRCIIITVKFALIRDRGRSKLIPHARGCTMFYPKLPCAWNADGNEELKISRVLEVLWFVMLGSNAWIDVRGKHCKRRVERILRSLIYRAFDECLHGSVTYGFGNVDFMKRCFEGGEW